ncbi:hypothetical protein IHE44_0006735 [Lamprotornis superbus]|uniref:Uncharacterized protein n=1 Tax=Lamprotornis superbus TaxID=245042 RepID=A0A835NFX5_9PASS|nr:hypothetical protein IHE44_0006735 [Lamprotornis superbus]
MKTDSILLAKSSISIFSSLFSFSSFCFTRCRLSICSPSSAVLSAANNLLNELNAGSQVHAKVNELPFNPLLLVLLLLQHEHVVVEKLLQFLIVAIERTWMTHLENFLYLKLRHSAHSPRDSFGHEDD